MLQRAVGICDPMYSCLCLLVVHVPARCACACSLCLCLLIGALCQLVSLERDEVRNAFGPGVALVRRIVELPRAALPLLVGGCVLLVELEVPNPLHVIRFVVG